MLRTTLALAAGLFLMASAAGADTGEGRKDLQVFNDISKAVTRYAQFTIFDSVDANVKDGVVTLNGQVDEPKAKDRAEKLTKKVKGVKQVINNLTIRK